MENRNFNIVGWFRRVFVGWQFIANRIKDFHWLCDRFVREIKISMKGLILSATSCKRTGSSIVEI